MLLHTGPRSSSHRFGIGDILVLLGLASVLWVTVSPYLEGHALGEKELEAIGVLESWCGEDVPETFRDPTATYRSLAQEFGFDLRQERVPGNGRMESSLWVSGRKALVFDPCPLARGTGIYLRVRDLSAPSGSPDLRILDSDRGLCDGTGKPITPKGAFDRKLLELGRKLRELPFLPWLRRRLADFPADSGEADWSAKGYLFRLVPVEMPGAGFGHFIYAWPIEQGVSGFAAFCLRLEEEIVQTRNLVHRYSGTDSVPAPRASIRRSSSELRSDGAYTGLDGNTWFPVLAPES